MSDELGQLILGQTSAPKGPATQAPLASSGTRYAADINNPSGLGWNGKTWKAYDTPEEGVADTQSLVTNYLTNPQRNTPQAFVGTWVNGDPTTGANVQGGAYVAGLQKELANAGVQLNPNGTIPNTPEANAAITRAIIQHESAPQHVGKFLPLVSNGAKPQTDAYAPADQAISLAQTAPAAPSLGDLILGGTPEMPKATPQAAPQAPVAGAPQVTEETPSAVSQAAGRKFAEPVSQSGIEQLSFKNLTPEQKAKGEEKVANAAGNVDAVLAMPAGLVKSLATAYMYLGDRAMPGAFPLEKREAIANSIGSALTPEVAKHLGIDPNSKGYQEALLQRIGQIFEKGIDYAADKTGLPKSDLEAFANLLPFTLPKIKIKGAVESIKEQFAIKKGEAKPVGERIEPTTGVSEVPIDTPEIRALSEKLDANRIKYDELTAAAEKFPENTPERMAAQQKANDFFDKNVDPLFNQLEKLERNSVTPQRGVMPETNVPVEQLTPQESVAGNLQQQFAQKKMEQMPVGVAVNEPVVQPVAPIAPATTQVSTLSGAGAAEIKQPNLRQARANELDVPIQLSKDQATRDPADVRFARETAKDPVLGAKLQAKYAEDNAKLQQNLDIAIEKTGAELTGINPGDLADRIVKTVEPERRRRYGEVNTAYTAARNAGEMSTPIEINPIVQYLDKNSSAATNAPVLTSVAAELKKLAKDKDTLSINDLEEVRKMVNNIAEPGTPNGHYGKEINRLIDRLTENQGGDLYKQARKLNAEFMTEFENTPVIRNLTAMKRGTTQRVVALEDLVEKSLIRGSLDDVKQLFGSFERMGPAGESLAKELRGFVAEKIKADATKGVSRDINGKPYLSTQALDKIIVDLDKSGKLDYIFGKNQADKFRTINEVTKDLQTVPVGTTNPSGTASTLLATMAEMGAQTAMTGVPLPVAMVARHLYGKRQTTKKLNKIQEFLDYGKNL